MVRQWAAVTEHSMDSTSAEYIDSPIEFLQSVLGACSITKTVIQAYGLISPDPNELSKDYRADLDRMRQLCRESAVEPERLADLEALLDLFDRFVEQGRRVTMEQQTSAEKLNRSYVNWCEETFFDHPNP